VIDKANLILSVITKHSDEDECEHSFETILSEIFDNDNKSKGLVPMLEPKDQTTRTISSQEQPRNDIL